MRVPYYGRGRKIPSPRLVAAWLKIDNLAAERVPLWAAHWIADGHDGEALRTLAGLDGSDTREVRDVLPAALNDARAPIPDDLRSAVNAVYDDLAALHLADQVDAEWLIAQVEQFMVSSDWHDAYHEPPLGSLYGLHDEWEAGWGRPRNELAALVRQACMEQVGQASATPG
ncbi:hypothetical protein [Actinomadura rudentiformis]|uniref:Uncharacterized protein n=1 Tax=Actinomadura rudentiformis TaxID=359158 RepID=A0A6H9Z2G5_9ACTN|nr:hypothetical protein [Actinomadura rudentiformis]KAB2352222.1 hypothetical protein F8566_00460 [Actinomadura rudentiformis]